MIKLKPPFTYFGGKSKVAHVVWQGLGNVKNYFEPFFGSGAVLLQRPNYDPRIQIETVNDKSAFLSNVWRSLQQSPDEVAKYCDYPVNHADLSARKKKLIENENYLIENLITSDTWHDPKLAGYWIWAASCWIGSGLTNTNQIPHITGSGEGVHKIGSIPHITGSGEGVHKIGSIPHITDSGKGVQEPYNTNIYTWFRQLSERLRYVRVVCGEWDRICNGNWHDGICGFFFDPPYGVKDRDASIYHHDSIDIAKDVLAWCKEKGVKKNFRIIVAGYEEYQELIDNHGWKKRIWKANGGYGKNNNRYRETLYFSPHCLFYPNLF